MRAGGEVFLERHGSAAAIVRTPCPPTSRGFSVGRSAADIILGPHPEFCECVACCAARCNELAQDRRREHDDELEELHHQELPLLDVDTAELLENEIAIDHWEGTWAD